MNGLAWAQRLQADPDLSSNARLVGLALATHARGRHAVSEASKARLAAWTGLSDASVHRATRELLAAGWLVAMRQTGPTGASRSSRFALLMPEDQDHPQRASSDFGVGSLRFASTPTSDDARSSGEDSQPVDNPCGEPVGGCHTDTPGVSHRHPTRVSHRHPSKENVSTKAEGLAAQVSAIADRLAL